ncbi:nesprin-2 isoform X4 [Ascaphus truei]|uniref:nesprin-2 isoform X4 n=1 Tax=Ascaphus truei TaxID=8439 RepID=UPI003F5925C2
MSSDHGSSVSADEEQRTLGIDDQHHMLQAVEEGTQKKTFTSWINSQLSKHHHPSVITDLFTDVQDGHVILDLLEVLSGEELPREKGKNIFQSRINIDAALTFLGKRSIQLINIHVEDIVSGKPSIVLGLIWKIILHFHIDDIAGTSAGTDDQQVAKSESKNGGSPTASPPPKRNVKSRWKESAKKALLQWAKEHCAAHGSIHVTDFKSSWKNGHAFLAIIHSLRPDIVDLDKLKERSAEENLKEAFRIAEHELKIPRLLEPEDVDVSDPDEKSIMTYVAQFLQYSKNVTAATTETPPDEVRKTIEWLNAEEQILNKLFAAMKGETYTKKYQEILLFMRRFNEQKRLFISDLSMKALPVTDQQRVRQSLENITSQIAEWKKQLDGSLPAPLRDIETWLLEVESLMSQKLPESESHYNTMSLLQKISGSFKGLMAIAANYLETLKSFKNIDENGVVLVPTDKIEEMKARLDKMMAAHFSALLDYRCSGHYVLALVEEGKSKLKVWNVKYKTQDSVQTSLADWNDFVDEKQFLVHLESAFQKFKDLNNQMMISVEHSDEPETIIKEYEVMESKYNGFVNSVRNTKSTLEKVLLSWTSFEKNITLLTFWLDEVQRTPSVKVPMEILSKWKSVRASLNKDGNFLMERTNDKVASKISNQLKSVNSRWTKYTKSEKERSQMENGNTQKVAQCDESEGKLTRSLDVSADSLRRYIQTLQITEENAGLVEMSKQILICVERYEERIGLVQSWISNAETSFGSVDQHKDMQAAVKGNLQNLYDRGISCQEHAAEAEKNVQAVMHIILNHKELQHFRTDGMQRNIARIRERVQTILYKLGSTLHPADPCLSESDIKDHFKSSKSKLETYIANAMHLLGQKVSPDEFISQYEKTLSGFDSESLDQFLKAADRMKSIAPANEKSAVEQGSSELRTTWKAIHDELESYVFQLKMHIEKNKCKELFCKLEKQINKGKELVGVEDNEKLIKEHKIFFCEEGCAGELHRCLQAMKWLCDTSSTHRGHAETHTLIAECTIKKQELDKRAADMYTNLLSRRGQSKAFRKAIALTASEIGMKKDICKSNGVSSSPEISEIAGGPQNGGSFLCKANEVNGLTLVMLLDRYDAVKSNLESCLECTRDTFVADTQDVPSLQSKLQELQVLQAQANSCWTQFETTSREVEKLMDDTEKATLSEKRNAFQSELHTADEEIAGRIQSLKATLNFLLPIEQEVVSLCDSNQQPQKKDMERFTLSNIESIFQELKDVQSSVEGQIQQCDNLESSDDVVECLAPVDFQAAQSIVHQYKKQLEATNETMRDRETILKALGGFMSSLVTTKQSIEVEGAVMGMDRTTLQKKKTNLEALQKDISRMREEAERLDDSLQTVEVCLEDPECGGETSCQKLIAVFSDKVQIAQQAVLQELENLQQREVQETLTTRQKDLCKGSQATNGQISRIGLKDPTIRSVQLRYDAEKSKLESFLQCTRENLVADSAGEVQDVPSLQRRLQELQVLQAQANSCWTQFETTSREVEKLMDDTEKATLSEKRNAFQSELHTADEEIAGRIQSLRATLNFLLPIEQEVVSLCDSNQQPQKKDMEQFTLSNIESIFQELKDVQSSVEGQIQQCDNLESSDDVVECLAPVDFQAAQSIVHQYKKQLEATNETMRDRETILKALGGFMTSFVTTKQSIEVEGSVMGMDRTTLQKKKTNLEALQKDISRMREEAERLDDSLQTVEVCLEDPECGGETSCQKLIAVFSDKVQIAQQAVLQELENLQQREVQETLTTRQKDFCKSIQDIRDQMGRIGLKDPTIHSVQLRMKSLANLEKELDACASEKLGIIDGLTKLLHPAQVRDYKGEEQCELIEALWEDTRLGIIESKEQCEKVMEHLRQFQSCKTKLTSVIQKGEDTILQQSSYMGKENLQKMMSKVEALKQEFDAHSENIDQINSICKGLQFHLNTMKSFEHSPFQNEASMIVDKWLDINEKMENYAENLKSAFCAWNKILHLSEDIEQWVQAKMRFCEDYGLTEDEVALLNVELQLHEQNLEEFDTKATEIQHILQNDEPPLELQVLKTSLLKKMEPIRMYTTSKAKSGVGRSALSKDLDSVDAHLTVTESTEIDVPFSDDVLEVTNAVPSHGAAQRGDIASNEKLLAGKSMTTETKLEDHENYQWEYPTLSATEHQRNVEQRVTQSALLEPFRLRLTELMKMQEGLHTDLQPGLQEKEGQLASFKTLLLEAQELTESLEELKPEETALLSPSLSSGGDQWLEIRNVHGSVLKQLQDAMQILGSRVQEHQQYQSLTAALNSEMTSFSEELLNFTGTSCEQKMHKLQELHVRFGGMEHALMQMLPIAGYVQQSTSPPGGTMIQEAMEMYRSKMRGFREQLEGLKQHMEQSPSSEELKENNEKMEPEKKVEPESLMLPKHTESAKGKKGARSRKKKKVELPHLEQNLEEFNTKAAEMQHILQSDEPPVQDAMQILGSRVQEHQQYQSLTAALNSEMTSFSEELLNFTGSSCEQKMHKLQELHVRFGGMEHTLMQMLPIAGCVQQSTSPPVGTMIQEAMEMYRSKMRGFREQLEGLKQHMEQSPSSEELKENNEDMGPENKVPPESLMLPKHTESTKGKKGARSQKKKKDAMQILGSRVQEHQQYQSLTAALNSEMTSFSEELLNFTGSSCEQKMHKLQELHVRFGGMEHALMQMLPIAGCVQQSTSPPGGTMIQEAMEMYRSKMRGFREQLEGLEQHMEQSPSSEELKDMGPEKKVPSESLMLPIHTESAKGKNGTRSRKKKKLIAGTRPGEKDKAEDRPVREDTSQGELEAGETSDRTQQNISVMSSNLDSGSDHSALQERFKDLQQWLQGTRRQLETHKNTQCDEDQLAAKISTIQRMHAEIVLKRNDLGVMDSKRETERKKAPKVRLEKQEVVGQLEKLLLDCDSYRRQLESSLKDLNNCGNEFHRISSLLSAVEGKLNKSDMRPDNTEKVRVLHEIQPLYEEVKVYIGVLDQACNQAAALKVSCMTDKKKKHLKEKFECVTNRMIPLSEAGEVHVKSKKENTPNGESSCNEHVENQEKLFPSANGIFEKPEVRVVEDWNVLSSGGEIVVPQTDQSQTQEDSLAMQLQCHFKSYQKGLEEILSKLRDVGQDEIGEVDLYSKEKTLERFTHNIKLQNIGQNVKIPASQDDEEESNQKEVERHVSHLKNQAVELDIKEADRQVQEIEKLYDEISNMKSKSPSLKGGASPVPKEVPAEGAHNIEHTESQWESLLCELNEMKAKKQRELQMVKGYCDALSAAKLSLQTLLKEKENLKVGPTESHTTHLDRITHFLHRLMEEKTALHRLKSEQANICSYGISSMEKGKTESDLKQLQQRWEQIELAVENKHDRLVKEAEELTFLNQKVDDVRHVIQAQQDRLQDPISLQEDDPTSSLLLAADIQAIKHVFSSLKDATELQMKRTWGHNENKTLENSLDGLQSQLEILDQRASDRPLMGNQPQSSLLEKNTLIKPLYEALVWVKKSHSRATFQRSIALLPEDVGQQITDCKTLHEEIVDKKSTVDSSIENLKHLISGPNVPKPEDFSLFFHQLQELYQERVLKSIERLQQLESGLEKRKTLFSEIEKLEGLLQSLETEATPVKGGIFTATALYEQLNCLKSKTAELEEIEGLVLTLLRNSQNYHGEIKISEQLYLNDILRSLKSKASRIRRWEERKFSYIEKILRVYTEFLDRTSSLNEELNTLQNLEQELHDEGMRGRGEDIEKKLQVAQNAISLSQDHLSQICRYKELFEDGGLCWDSLTVDHLQNQCVSVTKQQHELDRQLEMSGLEQIKYQALVAKIKLMVSSIQREAVAIRSHFDMVAAQVLLKKIKAVNPLTTEAADLLHKNQSPDVSLVQGEERKIKLLENNMDRLHQYLSQLITDLQTRCRNEASVKGQLEHTLSNLKKIDTELQQPFVIELDKNKIADELMRLEALDEISKAELHDITSICQTEINDDRREQLDELNGIEKHLVKDMSIRINAANESCKNLQKLEEAVTKAMKLFTQFETQVLTHTVDLSKLEVGSEPSDLLVAKRDELNATLAEIQDLSNQLKPFCMPEAKEQLDNILCEITTQNSLVTAIYERKISALVSCPEKYQIYKGIKQKICEDFKVLETIIRDSCSQKPVSYKEALQQWEKSKTLVTKLYSAEEELVKLKKASRELDTMCNENDVLLMRNMITTLFDKWLYLLDMAQDLEISCEELKQEWKLITEEMEREMILLDNFQEEAPENLEKKQSTEHLLDSLTEVKRFQENVKAQQLQLCILRQRVQRIQPSPESSMQEEWMPVTKEIQSMQEKCQILQQKAQKNEQALHAELRERDTWREGVRTVKASLLELSTTFQDLQAAEKAARLQELQSLINLEKQKANTFMENLRIHYSEIVPAEITAQADECQSYLEETEEKVKNEVLQSCPRYIMTKKVEEIKSGLKSIEDLLTQKSENILNAKALQKKIWDDLDVWHSKLNALESEVQDLAEEDPGQAQEWMDNLYEPFRQYQQVSSLVERRSANLNKAAGNIEEYEEILKNMETWIQNTNNLLGEELKNGSAKALSKHATALEMALEDSEQKEHVLHSIYSELGELVLIFETENTVQRLNEISNQVRELQQRILDILPHIQHVTDEVVAIETEVKAMEKDAEKIKTILTSHDIVDMSPKEHHKHGQVILNNIASMKKTVAEIEAFKADLKLSEAGVHSLCVFRRAARLLKEFEILEKVTEEQNELLEPIITEITKLDQEQEKLKHLSKNFTYETTSMAQSDVKEKAEEVKERIEGLNQKKEAVLLGMRSSVTERLERLQLEQNEQEEIEAAKPTGPEEIGIVSKEAAPAQVQRFLPSLAEEAEDVSLSEEADGETTVPNEDDFLEAESGSEASIAPPAAVSDGFPQGDPGKTLADMRSEPELTLRDCQGRITEVELWLQRANLSLASNKQDPDMQQTVEQQLARCQNTLQEIERKICTLLEGDKDWNEGNAAILKEAETLSLKLKTLKSRLEHVQAMLQAKPSTEQLYNGVKISSKAENASQPTEVGVLEPAPPGGTTVFNVELLQHKDLTKDIFHDAKLGSEQTQGSGMLAQSYSRSDAGEDVPDLTGPQSNIPLSASEDPSWCKWQYLQKELAYRIKTASLKHVNEPEVAKVVKISVAPRFPVSRIKSPVTEELKNITIQLESLSAEAPVPLMKENEKSRKLFGLLYSVSQWLQNLEEMLDMEVLTKEEAPSQLEQFEKLAEDLGTLSAEMTNKKKGILKPIANDPECTEVLSQCYNDIQAWLKLTRGAAVSKAKCIQMELDKNSSYQNDIRQLYEILLKKKTDLAQHLTNGSTRDVTEQLQEVAVYERDLQNYENQVSSLKEQGGKRSLTTCLNVEIHKLEDVLNDVWRLLRARQEELACVAVSASQLDALMCGIRELLAIGKEKVSRCKSRRSISKEALGSHLRNYKQFFKKLGNQVLLLQNYTSKIPQLVLSQEGSRALVQEAALLQEQAEPHGIHLMSLLKNWREFDSKYDRLSKELEALGAAVPNISLVEETEEKVMERINQYQQMKQHFDAIDARRCQILVEGKEMLTAVNCPELEAQITKMEQQWLHLTKKVNHELHRLESLLRHLACYSRDSAELSVWLESAHQRLSYWKQQSLDASQDLDTVRNNLIKFFEFANDVDKKSSLKTSVLNTASHLLRLKEADTAVLKGALAKFEEEWTELIAELPPVLEKLQQLQMDKLPACEAIDGLGVWMDQAEHIRVFETDQNLQTSACDVRNRLQECKDFRRKMNQRQWVVDYVNQSLLQPSVGDVESTRYERTEFAERLGSMNLQWNQMQRDLNRKIQLLEQTLETITENESRRQTLINWFDAQQQRLNKLHGPSSVAVAENSLAECKDLEEHLVSKSNAIEELKKGSVTIESGGQGVLNEGAVTEILFKKRDVVANQVADLKSLMQSVLQHWNTYDKEYGEVNRMTYKLFYILGQSKPPLLLLHALRSHLKSLQSVQEEVEQHEKNWTAMRASMDQLRVLSSPSAIEIMEEKSTESHARWTTANQHLTDHVQSVQLLLQPWEAYNGLYLEHTRGLGHLEGKCDVLLYAGISEDKVTDTLKLRMQELHELQLCLRELKSHLGQVSELADKVMQQDAAASEILLSERLSSSHRIARLEKTVSDKATELEFIMHQGDAFKTDLETLQARVKSSGDVLDKVCLSRKEKDDKSDVVKCQLLELSELSPDIERLNEESFTLPLDDHMLKMLQNLNRMWAQTAATALEECREQQMVQLEKNNFVQNYKTWVQSLEKMENSLTVGIAGTFEALKKQQQIYERLQAEIAINEQILPSFVTKALSILEAGEEENRTEFILRLAALKEKWQKVIRLVQQRKREINGFLKQWWYLNVSKQRLAKCLVGIQNAVASVNSEKCHSLYQTRKLIHDFKHKERVLKRRRASYSTTVGNCKDLLSIADPGAEGALQTDLSQLEKQWESVQLQLDVILTQLNITVQKWQDFERKVEDIRKKLSDQKVRVDVPLPQLHEALQKSKEHTKELEESLGEWNESLKDLNNMKTELSHYMIAEDGMVLKKQVEALHRQWEELCLRVSMRKQEIEDRLNAWNVFNEKNKELCEWLTHMESKVLQTADVNIEEMIEKLQKDCMEEINLFSENKLHLKQIGEQLIVASNKARSTEIDNKLNKINDRWQHLFDVIGSRVKKLKETFVIIQQLDKNMSNLRTWLARIESELSKPVIYNICDDQEIQKKLAEQQDLQKDIELHSTGVSSVLNICEHLLHDTDACANETECDSIQQTTRSLDKRWRNICAMSMERRMRIEETWRLWQKFLEDYSRFEEWLSSAERTAALPSSSEVFYTIAKEEQKKFEAFQRQIHERLTQLELINKQYRRLARENRTDAASRLKQMVHEGNQRWDQLQKRVAAIIRRLKYFTSQREEFEGTRDNILVWLTEMDLQLTNVEHFSESDVEDKMRQLIGFQQEITLNTNKIDQLIVFGEQLIQKSEAMDAVIIEDELEELHKYCQEVFGRVSRFHQRLTSRDLHLEEERDTSEYDTDAEDSREMDNSSWHKTLHEMEASHQSLCHLMPPTLAHERSGRETPVSVDSIPLEWDHTVDVGGSSSHEDEEEGTYYSALSDVEIPENPEAYVIMTTKSLQASSGKSDLEAATWHSPDSQMSTRKHQYKQNEMIMGLLSATPGSNTIYDPNSSVLMSNSSVTGDQELRTQSTPDGPLMDEGLLGIASLGTHSGVIERWEIINAQSLSNDLREKQNLQQWQQLNADLNNITAWLEKTESELDQVRTMKEATNTQELEHKVKKLKDTLKAFDNYKALVISANLSSKEFQQADDAESKEVLSGLQQVNSRWDKACQERDTWRESLQSELMQCEDFHEKSHQLLLWLTCAENRRCKARVADRSADPHVLLESQKQLMQLEEQLLERQIQVNSMREISNLLLVKTEDSCVETDEKVHVVENKLRQLLKDVSQDLETVQQALDNSASVDEVDAAGSLLTAISDKVKRLCFPQMGKTKHIKAAKR